MTEAEVAGVGHNSGKFEPPLPAPGKKPEFASLSEEARDMAKNDKGEILRLALIGGGVTAGLVGFANNNPTLAGAGALAVLLAMLLDKKPKP